MAGLYWGSEFAGYLSADIIWVKSLIWGGQVKSAAKENSILGRGDDGSFDSSFQVGTPSDPLRKNMSRKSYKVFII